MKIRNQNFTNVSNKDITNQMHTEWNTGN